MKNNILPNLRIFKKYFQCLYDSKSFLGIYKRKKIVFFPEPFLHETDLTIRIQMKRTTTTVTCNRVLLAYLSKLNGRFIGTTLTIHINVSLAYRSRGTCSICSTGGRPSPESSTITVSG